MIIGYMEHLADYAALLPRYQSYVEFYQQAESLEEGRYELEEGDYAVILSGTTVALEDNLFEIHESYADLQVMLEGQEEMQWERTQALVEEYPFDSERDIAQLKGTGVTVPITPGRFYYVLPSDAHKPSGHRHTPHSYKKVVFKVNLKA